MFLVDVRRTSEVERRLEGEGRRLGGREENTDNNPASTPLGIRFSKCRNGPVNKTRHSDPCAKFDTRCSTTPMGYS